MVPAYDLQVTMKKLKYDEKYIKLILGIEACYSDSVPRVIKNKNND